VLRHRTEGDLERGREVARGAFGPPAQAQDLPAPWFGDDLDSFHGATEFTWRLKLAHVQSEG
jgi:hypothetical protein